MISLSLDSHPVHKGNITLQKNCVISAVGRNSLHREWTNECSDFDLHLIVYDDSLEEFRNDSPFIHSRKGYKLKLVYHYLQNNPEFLNNYEYFFLPDDDISMDSENISKLFQMMEQYNLQIAQPGLSDSYYYYDHTLRDKFCILHYTNFVEIMVPCFSRKALQKVLFTFNETNSGWGVEIHWADLIGFTGKEIAVIDEVRVIHTRPTQSFSKENVDDFHHYLRKYNLKWDIVQTGHILRHQEEPDASYPEALITDRTTYRLIDDLAASFIQRVDHLPAHSIGIEELIREILLLTGYFRTSGKRKYLDKIPTLLRKANENLIRIKNDTEFLPSLLRICWCVEHLAQQKLIENNTEEVLEEFSGYLNNFQIEENTDIDQLNGLARYYITRIHHLRFETNKENSQEKNKLKTILIAIKDWSKIVLPLQDTNTTPQKLADCIVLLCEAKKIFSLPETDQALQRMTRVLGEIPANEKFPYLLKAYTTILVAGNTGNTSLREKTIHEVKMYYSTSQKHCFSQLPDIYFLYQIYQYTKDKRFKLHALEILNEIIEYGNASTIFRQITESIEEDTVKNNLPIRYGLIFVYLLSDKNSEPEYHILM